MLRKYFSPEYLVSSNTALLQPGSLKTKGHSIVSYGMPAAAWSGVSWSEEPNLLQLLRIQRLSIPERLTDVHPTRPGKCQSGIRPNTRHYPAYWVSFGSQLRRARRCRLNFLTPKPNVCMYLLI